MSAHGTLTDLEADRMAEHVLVMIRTGTVEDGVRTLRAHTQATFMCGYREHVQEMCREEAAKAREALGGALNL